MKSKRNQQLFILILCAIMASFSIVLDKFLQIPVGSLGKFTLYGLPLMIMGILFGLIPGLITGVISGVVLQLTSEYGIGPTSVFWALAPIAWGGFAGLFTTLFKHKLNLFKIIIIVVICSISALLLNTLAMVMEGVLMGSTYYSWANISLGLPTRIVSCVILCPAYISALFVIDKALNKKINNMNNTNQDD